jgi:CHAT domain-containing protein
VKKLRLAALFSVLLLCRYFDDPGVINASAQGAQEMGALSKDVPVEREIAGGQAHSYRLTLAPEQFLSVVVEAKNADTFATVYAPDGRPILEARNLFDTAKPERVFLIAESQGDYRIEVHALGPETERGRYVIRIEQWRIAAPRDRDLVVAARAFAEAETLQAKRTAEAMRAASAKYEEALPLFRAADDRLGEADALNNLANVNFSLGAPAKAIEHLNAALPLYRSLNDRHSEAVALQGIGLMSNLLGDWRKSLECYEQALTLWRADGDRWGEAGTLNNLGGLWMMAGEYQKALDHYSLALQLQPANNPQGRAVTLNNLGETHRLLGEYERAREFYDRSLALRRETKDARGEAATLNNAGLALAEQGDLPKALEHFHQALPLRRATGDAAGEGSTLANLCFVHHSLGDSPKALDHCLQSLALRRKVNDRRGEAATRLLIGTIQIGAGSKDEARENFQQALALSRAVGDRYVEAAVLKAIAGLERDAGNLNEARRQVEAAIEIVESLRSAVAGQELRASLFVKKQDYYAFNVDLLMRLHERRPDAGWAAAAFRVSERARARGLLEILTEARADIRQGVDPSLAERERRLQQQLNAKDAFRRRLLGARHTEQQKTAVEKELAALLGEYRELKAQIRARNPRYAALTEPQPLNLEEIQRELDDNTLLLEYALGEEKSFLWTVGADSMTSHELPNRAEIEAAARQVYELLTARNQRVSGETAIQRRSRIAKADAEFPRAATALSRMLLAPVAPKLKSRRLVIVSDGALQYIPFHALPAPVVDGGSARQSPASFQPLIAGREVVSLPSASVISALRQDAADQRRAEKLIAVLADPVFEKDDPRVKPEAGDQLTRDARPASSSEPAGLNAEVERAASETGVNRFLRLRFTRQEAEAITALAPAARRMSALDFTASRATLDDPGLANYRILHFATHGLVNSRHPELSGLVLSLVDERGEPQDGFLRLHEIYNLKLNAETVVLSGCRTALGQEIKGEGLVGLTRGFMYAGAKRVMASLWSVEDRATAELMKRFYAGMLGQNQPAATALRAAQLRMSKDKRWTAPYYWAAFTLQGEWK